MYPALIPNPAELITRFISNHVSALYLPVALLVASWGAEVFGRWQQVKLSHGAATGIAYQPGSAAGLPQPSARSTEQSCQRAGKGIPAEAQQPAITL